MRQISTVCRVRPDADQTFFQQLGSVRDGQRPAAERSKRLKRDEDGFVAKGAGGHGRGRKPQEGMQLLEAEVRPQLTRMEQSDEECDALCRGTRARPIHHRRKLICGLHGSPV
ncbi:hypothetical protein N4G69_33425 [Streptomyces mirabilis]|uniref:hypothetical protein n=1 Tax=Streptomyces mirabilis TaxID=68239 RepID=UPI0021BE0DF7|nr:hypothetical protein [Streptomyces mirabilis]MCT9110437.1 hypothetical protein [Streptomyces mirabilis]